MKNRKSAFWFVLIAVTVVSAHAQRANPESDFEVKKVGNGIEITKFVGKKTTGWLPDMVVIIPERIQNLPVTSIGNDAFGGWDKIISVTIPNSVTRIGDSAFNFTNLTSITIPASVTSIGQGAFSQTALSSVTFATGSNIADANFGAEAFPEGVTGDGGDNLKTAYAKGNAGTYTREEDSDTWTKK